MPASVESALILIVLIAPGFISAQVKGSLVPSQKPSAFQETVQAEILSVFMFPLWLVGGHHLIQARLHLLGAWADPTTLSLSVLAVPILVVCFLYLPVAPTLRIAYALVALKRPLATFAQWILRSFGTQVDYERGPEIWDHVFGRPGVAPWVRVWFKDRAGIEGVVNAVGLSPGSKQLYLSGVLGTPSSLVRLNSSGAIAEDLSSKQAEGVWIEIGQRFCEWKCSPPDIWTAPRCGT